MKRFDNTLSWQLLKTVLSLYLSITLVITLIQMGIQYLHTRNTIESELATVEHTFYPALATALWELNAEQLKSIQRGIVDLPVVSRMRIVDTKGRELTNSDPQAPPNGGITHTFKVSYRFAGQDMPLADVTFQAASAVVFDRVKLGFQMIVIAALIKSVALTLLFIWVFRRRLGRPLGRLTHAVAAIDLDSLGRSRIDLGQTRENELTQLEQAFNHMLTTLDEERQYHDEALVVLNKNLEQQVKTRTEELQEANRQLELLVRTDPLTGVANRRHFVERAEVEIQRAQRLGTPFSLLMIDLDHFKHINDTWGHATGDLVLRNFTSIAAAPLRAADLLARIGGEEFAILLPDTGLAGARDAAQRILEAARTHTITTPEGNVRYTASVGAALLKDTDKALDSLLSRADAALYRAKQAGRDRLEVEDPSAPDQVCDAMK